jgi:hypothetical protein
LTNTSSSVVAVRVISNIPRERTGASAASSADASRPDAQRRSERNHRVDALDVAELAY